MKKTLLSEFLKYLLDIGFLKEGLNPDRIIDRFLEYRGDHRE